MRDDPTRFSVDLTNCDREPIHQLGAIQDFGFLIAVSMDWLIQRASANLFAFTGQEASDVLGEPLSAVLSEQAISMVRARLRMIASEDASERAFAVDFLSTGDLFDVAIHMAGDSIVIEAERADPGRSVNPGALVKSMMSRLQAAPTSQKLFDESVRQLRAVTGFDRVMLYRFSQSGAGTVVAEASRKGLETYLGLNYPATDIPAQARALYVRNLVRIIADVSAEPVSIVPALDPDGRPLDLSLSVLRSVSPIHIEYLKNMGVGASYSISIVIDGKLWGLFALHHYDAKHLSMEMRSATELFGQMAALLIEGRLAKEQREAEEAARELHDRFVGKLMSLTPSVSDLADFANDLREIMPSDGFAVWAKGEVRSFGETPPAEEMPALARFLNRAAANRVYASDDLSSVYPKAADFTDKAAGVLAIPISRAPRDYLMFFRRELVRTVTWAGKPDAKEVSFGPNGARLTPRKSFEAWQETVRGKSRPWTTAERKAAEALRVSILEVLLRFNEESERQAANAHEQQELLIAELNHRVRNILALIRALVTQSRATAGDVDDFVRIISGRIQALARAHDQITDERFAFQDLREIVRTEFEAYVGGKVDRVSLTGPKIMVAPRAFSILALVFHEMVTNSAKYGALSDSRGRVSVDWHIDGNDCCEISWREEGGPAVQRPSRRGFGTTIIERSIPHDLGGEAEVSYRLAGLRARFVLPPAHFQASEESPIMTSAQEESLRATSGKAESAGQDRKGSIDGLNALLVEDNVIISMDAEYMLTSHGAREVFVAANVAEAMKIVEGQKIGIAILDVNLGNETSFPLVRPLVERGVPFVFVTGYGEKIEFPAEAGPTVRAIKKPFDEEELVDAMRNALS